MKDGYVTVYRSRILLIGQDRAGKTSLKKSLLGLPFDSEEQSTEGIEVDPSKCEIDVDQAARNWQSIGEIKPGLLECSKDVAKTVVEKIFIQDESSEEDAEEGSFYVYKFVRILQIFFTNMFKAAFNDSIIKKCLISNKDYVNLKVKQKLNFFLMIFLLSSGFSNNFSPSIVLLFGLIYVKLWHSFFRSVISLPAKLNHCVT